MSSGIKVYVRHLRPGHCPRAGRVWFDEHGLSWRDFVRNGIDVEILERFNEAPSNEVSRRARLEHAQRGQQ